MCDEALWVDRDLLPNSAMQPADGTISSEPPVLPVPAAHFVAIVARAPDCMILLDEFRRIVFFNAQAVECFGYMPDEVLGWHASRLFVDGAYPFVSTLVSQYSSQGGSSKASSDGHKVLAQLGNGGVVPVELTISHIAIDGRSYVTMVMRDLTERNREDEARSRLFEREHAARLDSERASRRATLLDRASAILDSSLDYEATVSALAKLCVPDLGALCIIDTLEEDDTVRRLAVRYEARCDEHAHVADVLSRYPRDTAREFLTRAALYEGRSDLVPQVTRAHLLAFAQDEEHLAVWEAIAPTSYMCIPLVARGRIVGAIALVACGEHREYDTSDLELLREIAARAAFAIDTARLYRHARRAVTLRDEVLGVVSHDLRSPLTAILLANSRLENEGMTAAERLRATSIIDQSVELMSRLIQDLLDAASIESGRLSLERQPCDMLTLAQRVQTLFEQRFSDAGVTLVIDVPAWLPRMSIDGERVLQVLGNLLANAVKFVPAGGTVTISATQNGPEMVVSVADNGIGISAEHVPQVFDRFWHLRRSLKQRGTGLGLHIAKGIVEAHGGRIWVESTEGQGSVFSFSLGAMDSQHDDSNAHLGRH